MQELIAFDIETTGLYPERGDRIVEIGAVPIVGTAVLRDRGFESLVNPCIPIPHDISIINGITDDMVKNAPPVETVLPEFLRFIGERPLVAHNAPFDTGFIAHYAKMIGAAQFQNPVIDTLQLSRKAFPHAQSHSLDALLHRLGITYRDEQRHRSMGDAYLTAVAYLRLIQL
jgi:DNA polymerase-3 subunit epsilon